MRHKHRKPNQTRTTMDYKYIEQLLDRYFECETTREEEQILRAFFAQENVPVRLLSYKTIFTETAASKAEERLGEDFTQRILDIVAEEQKDQPLRVKAIKVSMQRRLRPIYKAAACVAVVLALGQAAQMPYESNDAESENFARSLEKPAIQQDANTVAKSDSSAVKMEKGI